MIKQAMQVTPDELFKLADKLIEEAIELNIPVRVAKKKKFQVNIINKEPKCSDTWQLEK